MMLAFTTAVISPACRAKPDRPVRSKSDCLFEFFPGSSQVGTHDVVTIADVVAVDDVASGSDSDESPHSTISTPRPS
jgi:hypothetical protein